MSWQTIETAPKDGDWILGYNFEPVIIRWASAIQERYVSIGDNKYEKKIIDVGYWETGKGFFSCAALIPTHWMPLPTPPKQQ